MSAKSKSDRDAVGVGCVIVMLWMPVSVLVNAWTASVLWGWFVVPLGLAQISIAHAFGLALVSRLFVGLGREDDSRDPEATPSKLFITGLTRAVFLPAIVLGLGWLARGCM